MSKVNISNSNGKHSDIFPCDIFKSDVISFLSKSNKAFQLFSKSKFLSFMNNGNETKSEILSMGHIQIWHHFSLFAS